jgi:cytochrome d ubiquinol oxidase subunit II
MVALWFAILCLMFILFVVLAGWDFGAGALHFAAARNQAERGALIAAIGPLWTWNEVWLVAGGGVLFVAFPRVLAISFPAYYLALFLVLWTLILRGISLEVRGLIPSGLWRTFWDFTFAAANISLAILFGAAIGNVIRGMPLKPDSPLSLPLFTDFGLRGGLGILDWYTVSTAIFTLTCLCAHGASYLALKAEGEVYRRAAMLAKWLWPGTVLLLLVVSLETFYVRPALFTGMAERPLAWLALALAAGGLGAIVTGLRSGAELRTFLGGCAFIAGLLSSAAASLFPVILYSTVSPEYSITAYNGSSDASSLRAAIYWWPVAFALSFAYLGFVARHYRGRARMPQGGHDGQY